LAAVEFALTVPIFFLLLFAALEFGRYYMIFQTVNNAAYEAARRCILPRSSVSDGQGAGIAILSAVGLSGGTVTITPNPITDSTTQLTVIVTVPYASNVWIAPAFLGNGSVTAKFIMTCDWVDSAH
jgi:Flp pilus assembly protein TadG